MLINKVILCHEEHRGTIKILSRAKLSVALAYVTEWA